MSIKHTQSWVLSDDNRVRRVIKSVEPKPRTIVIIESWTTEEDAKLIAAAPSLADALEKAQNWLPLDSTEYAAARAALRAAGRIP